MRSLYSRIAVVLVALMLAVGLAFLLMVRWVSDQYFQEVTQRLNATIAAEVSAEMPLIENGVANLETMKQLAHDTMMINPTVEVYLLDPDGVILGHALDEASVVLQSVNLEPVRQYLGGDERRPLKGDDPRNIGLSKIFSAAPVFSDSVLEGYLYVILGGQKYDMLADQVSDTYVFDITFASVLAILVISLLTGLYVFRSLTLRLRMLGAAVERYGKDSNTRELAELNARPDGDEVDLLSRNFSAMALRIEEQFLQLSEADNQRRDLVANISHDLRTPLASMQGFVETLLLKDGELSSDERKKFLKIARKHGSQLIELVNDLFELAKLDAHATELKLEEFSLVDLVHDIAQEFQLDAEKGSIQFNVDTPEIAPLVRADIGLMQRVLQNLISNALAYTPSGGAVNLKMRVDDNMLCLSISDTGTGVAPEVLPHIFERFYRGQQNPVKSSQSQETERVRSSAGLGLAIVKRILELHTITIRVSSKLSEGTRFSFDIPAVG